MILTKIYSTYLSLILVFLCVSCGTGIEDQTRITDKDVLKVETQYAANSVASTLKFKTDSVQSWKPGKMFYVTDNRVRLIFQNSSAYHPDSVELAGKYLIYRGSETGSIYDNSKDLILCFSDAENTYRYNTNKTIDEISPSFSIPFLIDMDMINQVAQQLVGKTFYVRTRIWYNPQTLETFDGRQFIQVKVDSVLPGDKVLPIKVIFTAIDNGQKGMLRMSGSSSAMRSHDFDAMFSLNDLHLNFPNITAENWTRIQNGVAVEGMNKDECRLAKGSPKSISRVPDQDGLREYWFYDGGVTLYFADGILKGFKQTYK